jgi:hypothetical protein
MSKIAKIIARITQEARKHERRPIPKAIFYRALNAKFGDLNAN